MTRESEVRAALWLVLTAAFVALVVAASSCAAALCTSHPYDPKCALAPAQCRETVDAGPTAR